MKRQHHERVGLRLIPALLAAVAVAAGGCAAPETPAPPSPDADLVLVTIDTLRADVLGFMGGPPDVSPALDRLAATGAVFTFAHAHSVVTLPSHASILTGRLPYEHGVRANAGFSLPDGIPTLAESLRAGGFATAAFVSAFPLDRRFGLARGFEVYDDDYGRAEGARTFLYAERSADRTMAAARRWWDENDSRRRFLWLHFFDPHFPYEPPEPIASRFRGREYEGEVAVVDRALEPFLRTLTSAARPAVIAVTADHGEGLGDHGEETHGLFAYEPTLWVPLVLAGPGIESGRDDRPAALVDLMPTLLDLAGIEMPAAGAEPYPGRSLRDRAPSEPPPHYFESLTTNLTNGWAPLRGVLLVREKYIDLPIPELYDLASDPAEARNLADDSPERLAQLHRRLPRESVWPPEAGATTIEDQANLRALGYLAGSAEPREQYGVEDDPKNLLELDQKLQRMVARYAAGERDRAAALAREVIGRRPQTPVAHSMLVQVALDAGRPAEAVELMRDIRRRGLATDAVERQLALTLVELGRGAEAIEVIEPLVRAAAAPEPEDLLTHGLALSAVGRNEAAASQIERGLGIEPSSTRLLEAAALVALRRQRFDEAAQRARSALDLDRFRPAAWNILGVALYSSDRPGALEAWQRCVELDPRQFDALFNLGVVAAEKGRADVARPSLQRFLAEAPPARYAHDFEVARSLLRDLPSGG